MKKKIENLLEKACAKLYEQDRYLINMRVCERAIVFRLGIYLQTLINKDSELKLYNLDNEYNKNNRDLKRVPEFENGTYPDLIIHKRGSNRDNMLIIECKTEWNDDISTDIRKLKQFINITGRYKYKYGISIIFRMNMAEIRILEYGKEDEIKILHF